MISAAATGNLVDTGIQFGLNAAAKYVPGYAGRAAMEYEVAKRATSDLYHVVAHPVDTAMGIVDGAKLVGGLIAPFTVYAGSSGMGLPPPQWAQSPEIYAAQQESIAKMSAMGHSISK